MSNIIKISPGQGRGETFEHITRLAADWIYRFGYSSRDIMENHLFSSEKTKGLVRALFAKGWATEIPCFCGDPSKRDQPKTVIVLTPLGVAQFRDEYDTVWEYPEVAWTRCDLVRCDDLLYVQQATANNLRTGSIDQFWTPRMILGADPEYPLPDTEWLTRTGERLSVDADTGCSYPWRHRLCLNLSIRMGADHPIYNRAALLSTQYEIVEDYHERLKAGKKLPIWADEPEDFVPLAEVEVPDLSRKMVVFLAESGREIVL